MLYEVITRPAGRIVRLLGRPARVLAQVGIDLRLEAIDEESEETEKSRILVIVNWLDA